MKNRRICLDGNPVKNIRRSIFGERYIDCPSIAVFIYFVCFDASEDDPDHIVFHPLLCNRLLSVLTLSFVLEAVASYNIFKSTNI